MKKAFAWLTVLSVFLFPQHAFAVGSAGFENASFSAASLAEGNAVVAQADEPGAISYNPAGLTQLKGLQVQTNQHFISISTFVDSPRDSHLKSAGTIVPVPTGYITINPGKILNDRLVFGVGSDSPFGLSNKWDSNDTHVRYTGWKNYLKMFTVKPVMAVKIADWLSLGGGPIYYRIFDFGGIQAYPNSLVPLGLAADGQIRANLSGNTWGWQFGVLAKPVKKHSIGFYFRSPVTVVTRGRVKVENATSGNFETGANAKVDLPLNFTLGYAYDITSKTTIEADLGYTRWAAHERLYINADHVNTLPGDLVPTREDAILAALGKADKDYENSFSIHLGGKHKMTDKMTLRSGGWYYSQAVPGDHFIPAVPDSNRLGLACGLSYGFTKNLVLDLTYYNAFVFKRKIKNEIEEPLAQTVDGTYSSYIQNLSIGLTYKWENLFGGGESHPKVSQQKKPAKIYIAQAEAPNVMARRANDKEKAMKEDLGKLLK